jgi:hypothetical protein
MKSRGILSVGNHAGWEVVFEYATAQSFINGTTTLFSFTDYGSDYSELALFVEDQDGANGVRGVLDGSHGGVRKCASLQSFDDIAAGEEGCARLLFPNPATYVRGQVVNSSGFTVQGRWALLGKRRS